MIQRLSPGLIWQVEHKMCCKQKGDGICPFPQSNEDLLFHHKMDGRDAIPKAPTSQQWWLAAGGCSCSCYNVCGTLQWDNKIDVFVLNWTGGAYAIHCILLLHADSYELITVWVNKLYMRFKQLQTKGKWDCKGINMTNNWFTRFLCSHVIELYFVLLSKDWSSVQLYDMNDVSVLKHILYTQYLPGSSYGVKDACAHARRCIVHSVWCMYMHVLPCTRHSWVA